ncbi:uncharacterized protein CTRU02_207263 [Colletotrichum truncatum]|uniref:Uncharacterized protein n=1 Tax=Colletotrichum truncatum TaxID=5467 RepID=A0ACC3Z0B6_COLTU|nr:uncharacterized protein CTRU02_01101 [Colletotrichum truncatum]KAF6800696.1 hypothetical protein CTRU02_01101 [Colletotrichum truncatum]
MSSAPIVDEGQVALSSSPKSGASASKQWPADLKTGPQNTVAKTQEVTFLLSSRHLSLASSYFKAQLNGPWREASDVNALLLLMQIIHGKTKDVPNCVDLETLAKAAVLIDYYKCHETTGFFSTLWVKSLKSELPSDLNRELILWLMISVVFLQNDVFESITKTAVQRSDGPIPMLGLPIPQSVISKRLSLSQLRLLISIDAIDWRRQDAINSISTALINLLKSLCQESERCSFDCSAVLLGSLTKNMCDSELLNPTAQEPYLGYQLAAVEKSVQEFKSPSGRVASRNSSYGYHDYYHSNNRHCSCRLPDIIKQRLYPGLDRSKEGFSLQDLQLEL